MTTACTSPECSYCPRFLPPPPPPLPLGGKILAALKSLAWMFVPPPLPVAA